MPDPDVPIGEVLRALLARAHELDPAELAAVVADEAGHGGINEAEIWLVDRQQRFFANLTRAADVVPVDGSLMGDVYRRGRDHIDGEGAGSRVLVPLVDGVDRLGVLTAVVDAAVADVVAAVEALAALVAELILAKSAYTDSIERVRRVEEMDIAAEMRWALLPPLTMRTPRVSIAGMLEPAYEVAGDTFDYAVNADRAHVAVFDAVGHGLLAARLANLCVGAYRNRRRSGATLEQTAEDLDAVLEEQFGNSLFVTSILGELDLNTGLFRWIAAGHMPPLVMRAAKVVAELSERPGLPLGITRPERHAHEYQLEPRDTVVMYSDGVTEARSPNGEFFGLARLIDHVERAAQSGLSEPEQIRRLVVEVLMHQTTTLNDDATLMLTCWNG
ncbi:MAG TPA: PP2C family protein-serine/threonine phosphatase [Acidimicrobiia bacterium]|nr:PP2C family protein-serine/threonine phosphatase [Acidimicrobiia bacterium]